MEGEEVSGYVSPEKKKKKQKKAESCQFCYLVEVPVVEATRTGGKRKELVHSIIHFSVYNYTDIVMYDATLTLSKRNSDMKPEKICWTSFYQLVSMYSFHLCLFN